MSRLEYVKVSSAENVFGQNNLLRSQLELLNLVQSFDRYKKFRMEELVLKVSVKAKVEELLAVLERLNNLLPEEHHHKEHPLEKRAAHKKGEGSEIRDEIEKIRRKIQRLQSER